MALRRAVRSGRTSAMELYVTLDPVEAPELASHVHSVLDLCVSHLDRATYLRAGEIDAPLRLLRALRPALGPALAPPASGFRIRSLAPTRLSLPPTRISLAPARISLAPTPHVPRPDADVPCSDADVDPVGSRRGVTARRREAPRGCTLLVRNASLSPRRGADRPRHAVRGRWPKVPRKKPTRRLPRRA